MYISSYYFKVFELSAFSYSLKINAFRITMVETKTTLKTVSHNSSLKILAKNVKEHYVKSVRVWSFSGLNA